jgi:hypothetical protein
LLGNILQHLAAKAGFGLHRHTVSDSHQECREGFGFCGLRQVALGLRPFEAITKLRLTSGAKIYQRLSHRFRFIRSRYSPVYTETSRMVWVTRIEVGCTIQDMRSNLSRCG